MKTALGFVVFAGVAFSAVGALAQAPLGAPSAPAGNPITEPKRLLGKVLFWDEQLSSSNNVSCATCHAPEAGGGDPRRARSTGPDGISLTADDIFGSPGVIGSDASNAFKPVEGGVRFASQVTGRSSPSAYMAAYSAVNFWDGRALPRFNSPVTGLAVLSSGAALESQSVGPPVSPVEMAHDARNWTQIAAKIAGARPLALVDQVPPDVAAALADNPSYPTLFQRVFGTTDVNADRIAMAIATYERTLVPNQTPWDRYVSGEPGALTAHQVQGLDAFNSSAGNCAVCHASNRFTDNAFHNIGVRPPAEDTGRQAVSGQAGDRGRFKTPTLRNSGLRNSFFHNGQATTLTQAVEFYFQTPGTPMQFTENLDPVVQNLVMTPAQIEAVVDFIANGLTDPRVAAAQFPFDKPRLWSQRSELTPVSMAGGTADPSSGITPLVIASDPPVIGGDCRLGVGEALPGATAVARVSTLAPVGGVLPGGELLTPVTVGANGAATVAWSVVATKYQPGAALYVQWEVTPPGGAAPTARSDVARVVPFCPRGGCAAACVADTGGTGGVRTPDGVLDNNDFVVFIDGFFGLEPFADMGSTGGVAGADGVFDNNDFIVFIDRFFAGC